MPSVRTEARIVIVQNRHELHKPTNTGRLARHLLVDSVLLTFGERERAFDFAPLLDPTLDLRLVFHREEPTAALARDEPTRPGRRRGLVFLDGTWGQCSRMSRRIEALREVPVRVLPPGPTSPWRVRRETHPQRLSTLEAIIRAIAVVEGEAPAAVLRAWFHRVTARLMFMKGMLPSPEVPAAWVESGSDQPRAADPTTTRTGGSGRSGAG
jgi:hypothetical protein